jgi:lipid II:glycine glycyltransferase (peptidoglycan interpeptide bridge formation enzyme)
MLESETFIRTEEKENPLWDNFVSSIPGGYHEQTIPWAKVQAFAGWSSKRIILEKSGKIVAGAQILLQHSGIFGTIGYISYGPCIADGSLPLANELLYELKRFAKVEKVSYLVINPPYYGDYLIPFIHEAGFRPTTNELPPKGLITSTLLIDLTKSVDELLGEMHIKTRYNIRHASRMGIKIMEGTRPDIDSFFNLMLETCARRKSPPTHPDKRFFELLWDAFHDRGWIKLHFAEYNGEKVCAALSFSFGDVFRIWKFGWSGRYEKIHPSNALYWALIKFAKNNGYRYFDMVSVDTEIARELEKNQEIPPKLQTRYFYGPTKFKMGFGGKVMHLPPAYCYFTNPLLRFFYNTLGRKMLHQKWLAHLINVIWSKR